MIRFDRNELSGAFGDIGTGFPLIVGMILASGLDSVSALFVFGAMQILTGLTYGLPMPVQPLKAMAVIVITQKITGSVLFGGGLAIGLAMLVLTLTGLIEWLARVVPKSVVRGIQFGLGLNLAQLALRDYVQADAMPGYWLAGIGFIITVLLLGNRKYPPALFVILLGIVYAFTFKLRVGSLVEGVGFSLPTIHRPSLEDILRGFLLLALPQIPLSLGNSILATRQAVEDFFPGKKIGVRRISLTYSLMNLVSPFFSGIPVCHGSGGMAGHYAFGARTGGSVVIQGILYITLGLFFGRGFDQVIHVFPLPILGVILLFEALTLLLLIRDTAQSKAELGTALLVGLIAVGLPYGYVIGLVVGLFVALLLRKREVRFGG
jgi:hypothetical protein